MKKLELILKNNKYKYPLLIWSELDKNTTIYLATAKNKIAKIEEFNDGNLNSLIEKLEDITSFKNFPKLYLEGDKYNHKEINVIELEKKLSWKSFEKEFLNNFDKNSIKNTNKKLEKELLYDYTIDAYAYIVEAIIHSIFIYLINRSEELAVNNILFLGDFKIEERLFELIDQYLKEKYNIYYSFGKE